MNDVTHYRIENVSDIDDIKIIADRKMNIHEASEIIINCDVICRCIDVTNNVVEMDDRAEMYYCKEVLKYGDDFKREICLTQIEKMYGNTVANWVSNLY